MENINLIIKKIQDGDRDLLDNFIKENMNVVYKITNKYYGIFEDYEDLVQEGIIAFIQAIYSHDFSPYFLSQYAPLRIYNSIRRYIYSNIDRVIDSEKKYQIAKQAYDRSKKKLGYEPTYLDLAKHNRLLVAEAMNLLNIYNLGETRLDLKASDENYNLDETLENINRQIDSELLGQKISNSKLTDKEKDIVLTRYGFKDGEFYGIVQLGKLKNIRKQAVYLIDARAKTKLKRLLMKY